jgi:hypothetical protein
VKTLQDKPTLKRARTTTVRYLVTRPAPASLPDTRVPFERNVFTVTAAVVLVRAEDDGDFHVVLRSGRASTGQPSASTARAISVAHRGEACRAGC